MKIFLITIIFIIPMQLNAENIYENFFKKEPKTQYNDSLFERIIWHKKVSHLVIESLKDGFYVTLLVIPETPYNYKSKSYALHYFYKSHHEAFKKFIWVDDFLRKEGILKVKIIGSIIKEEHILSNGNK